ncbi:outer membrane beta-barrel protein [Paraflavisolibacter sp. H34]|uniref:outer membrane beta-barrel protein n=1 Tax=Huijunlia imazamoxiresistens TaxID=3127457 RepID=UPI0030170D41
MRRILFALMMVLVAATAFAQTDTLLKPRLKSSISLPRSNDHLMLQLGYTTWQGKTDSMNTGGIPRTFNVYFLLDFPFKSSPNWSVAAGVGVGTDNVYFDKTIVGIKDQTTRLQFRDVSDTNHFKRFKVATTYAEVPLELRYNSGNDANRQGFKAAIGVKIGTLLNAHTKGSILQDKSGNTLNSYKVKENSKRFFNQNRLAATARLGYGHFSLFGTYQITSLFKEGLAPTVRPLTVGLTLSGL